MRISYSCTMLVCSCPCAILVIFAGCRGGADPEEYKTPTPSPNQGEVFELNGTFARRNVLSQYVESALPGNGDDGNGYEQQTVTTYSLVFLEAQPDPTKVRYIEKDCLVDMTEVSGSKTTLDQGYYDHAEPSDYILTISGNTIGSTVSIEPTVEIKGATLDDPWNESLPTDATDARVLDSDEEGNPGYTIYVDGIINGTLWATQRYSFSFEGSFTGYDDVSGLLDQSLENSFMYSSSSAIPTDTDTYMDEVPGHNFFEMHRVEDSYDCSTLVDNLGNLFPETAE